jgi:DNA ligase-1
MSVLLAKSWKPKMDVTGWWMSEKLDGVRALWTGKDFESREGNVFAAPQWYKDLMPKNIMDGELFLGRGKFQELVSIVRQSNPDERWVDVEYKAFDLPVHPGRFEERHEALLKLCNKLDDRISAVCQMQVISNKSMLEVLDYIDENGGEGLMLRKPGSKYEAKRSSTLLKVKKFVTEEVTVIAVLGGKGRCAGMMGKLECRMDNGIEFKVGTGFTDEERRNPPLEGSRITVRYPETTNSGKPRFPAFLTERNYE